MKLKLIQSHGVGMCTRQLMGGSWVFKLKNKRMSVFPNRRDKLPVNSQFLVVYRASVHLEVSEESTELDERIKAAPVPGAAVVVGFLGCRGDTKIRTCAHVTPFGPLVVLAPLTDLTPLEPIASSKGLIR